jgi:hypothetical protein
MINFALARGISPLSVAKEHGLGTSAVYNHNRAHIEENYRKIIGSGVYANIDELLRNCTHGDAESLDVLNAMISGFFHNWSLAFANCRRPIKMSPVCQLQMTLPRGFPGGVGGDGSVDERWGAIAAGSAARSGSEAVDDDGSGTAAGARATSGVPAIEGLSDRGRDGLDLEATRAPQQPVQARDAASSSAGDDS